jgi:Fibronectin type III domain
MQPTWSAGKGKLALESRFALPGLLALLFFTANVCTGQNIWLAWRPSPDPDVAGYRLYYGTASGVYSDEIDEGTNLTTSVSSLVTGQTYYAVVKAYNSAGVEGPPSNEVAFTGSPNSLAPAITVVTPLSAPSGGQVFISGVNLSAVTIVQFGGVISSFVIASNTLVIATVPSGAVSGSLSLSSQYGSTSVPFVVAPLPEPANDNFTNAQVATGSAFIYSDNTAGATKEPGEPNHAGNSGGRSVWYSWTAPANGSWSLDTAGSSFTALLAVYTGNSLKNLSIVASNKTSLGTLATGLSFNAVKGASYQIAVDGFNGASGDMILRLTPLFPTAIVLSNSFETSQGFSAGSSLNGQNGWLCSPPSACGILNNAIAGYGQQADVGFVSSALPTNTVRLYRPLNYTLNTNTLPVIQFSVLMQFSDVLGLYSDLFGWSVRNVAGHELFRVSFNNATKTVTYNLDNGGNAVATGLTFDNANLFTLVLTMDFSRNRWSATLNGASLASGQPITASGAALSLGDIDALAVYQNASYPGLDAMVFDNYVITANPSLAPSIWVAPSNQTAVTGSEVLLGAVASGNPPLSYQWYCNSVAIKGATNAVLALYDVALAQAGNYMVAVSNAYGSVSGSAAVTITSPRPQASLTTPVLSGGRVLVNLTVASGNTYRVQVSTNLVDWSTLGNFYASGTNAAWFDPGASQFNCRFYRVVSP